MAGIPHLVKAGSNPKLHGAASALTPALVLAGSVSGWHGRAG